jgi:hypothetical protein
MTSVVIRILAYLDFDILLQEEKLRAMKMEL